MSDAGAIAFLERVESDEDFAKELESVKENPDAVHEKVHAAGFDATPDEIRDAFLERYGTELTPEQLDMIAAGSMDPGSLAGVAILGIAVVAGAAAV